VISSVSRLTLVAALALGVVNTAAAQDKDPDKKVGGSGVPAGYTGRVDRPDRQKIEDASWQKDGALWHVKTGPPHIAYRASDIATGTFTVSTRIDQLETPAHPEAYGIFVGGQNLDKDTQKYTYLIVRGTGEYSIWVRDGAGRPTAIVPWTANDAVTKADASGKGSYRLAINVANGKVNFMVNGKTVHTADKASVPTDGIAGLRVNHNLHVATTGLEIKKG
jgi:hypothetical protein